MTRMEMRKRRWQKRIGTIFCIAVSFIAVLVVATHVAQCAPSGSGDDEPVATISSPTDKVRPVAGR